MKKKETVFAEKIGKLLSKQRRRAKYSQEKLAEKIGTDMRIISNYESGKNVPSAVVIFKIAQALDVSVNEFVPAELKNLQERDLEAEQRRKLLKMQVSMNKLIEEMLDA